MDSKKKPDDWLAAYEAAKQKALQNLDSGKVQSVNGISGFCGKIKNVDHLSSKYNVTKLMNAMKDGKIKKKKTGQNVGGDSIEGKLSKNQREKERKKRRNAKRREENGDEIEESVQDDNSDNEAKPKSEGLTKNQRERERRKRRKKALAAGNTETEETVETNKISTKKSTKKSKSNILAQKNANQAILDEQKNRIMELQMGKSCDFQFPEKSGDSNADKNKQSKYAFKKFEFKPKPKESKAANKAPSSNGLKMIASSYDSKEINNDRKVKIEKQALAGKSKSKEQESMSQLNSTARWLTNLDSKEINNDKKVQVRKEVSTRNSKSEEKDNMNQLNSTARWLSNLESEQNYEKTPDASKNKKMSEPKAQSTTQTRDTMNDKKRKLEEEKVSSKRIKNDVIHMNSLGLGRWLKELESDPDTENNVDSDCDDKSSGPTKNFSQNPTKYENNKPLANSKVNDPSKTDIKDTTSKPSSQDPIKNNTDSWLAAYQAKKEAALKNMKEGKLQSVVGISAFCGKTDQVSNFSKTNQVTKLMDKFKREEVKPIKKQVQSPILKEPAKLNTKQVSGGNFKFVTKNSPSKPLMTTESSPKPLMSLNSSLNPLEGLKNPPKPLMTMNIPSKPQGSPVTQVRKNEGMLGHVPSGFSVGVLNHPGNGCPAPLLKNNMQGGAQTGPSAFDKKPPPPPDKAISEVIGDEKPFSSSSGVVGSAKPFSSIGSIRLSDNFLGNAGKTSKNNYLQNYQSPNFGMGVGQTIDGGMRGNMNDSGCGLKGWARVDNSMKGWASTAMRNIDGSLEAGVNSIGMSDAMTGEGVNSMGMGGAMARRGGNLMGMGGAMAERGGNLMGMGIMGGPMAGRGGNSMGMGGPMVGRGGNSMGMGGPMAGSSMGMEGNGNYMDSSFQEGMTAMRMKIPMGGVTSYMRGGMDDSMEASGYMRGGMGDSMEGSVGQGMRTGSTPPSGRAFGFGRQYGQYSEQEYNSSDCNESSGTGTLKNNGNTLMYSGENNCGYGQDFSAQSDNRTNRSKPTVTFGKAKSTQLFQWIKPS